MVILAAQTKNAKILPNLTIFGENKECIPSEIGTFGGVGQVKSRLECMVFSLR